MTRTPRWWVATSLVAAALALGACSGDDLELLIQLRTDLVPSTEFDSVHVEVTRGSTPIAITDTAASIGQNFIDGEPLTAVPGLEKGTYRVTVRLLRRGSFVAQRRVSVRVDEAIGVTVLVTRDCEGELCEDGSATMSCLAGSCLPPECERLGSDAAECGEPECTAPSDCAAPEATCATALCVEGACFYRLEHSSCGSGLWCHPTLGCLDLDVPPMDGGVPDTDGATPPTDGPVPTGPFPFVLSNLDSMFADMTGPDVALAADCTDNVIDADMGSFACGETVRGQTFDQGVGYPDLTVFVVDSLHIPVGLTIASQGANAVAIVSRGDVIIEGVLSASTASRSGGPGGYEGGAQSGSTVGNPGVGPGAGAGAVLGSYSAGGGGGGHGGTGGSGGDGADGTTGAAGGRTYGGPMLVPLVGGSGGGGTHSGEGGGGGGAIQISSATRIHVALTGGITAGGGPGYKTVGGFMQRYGAGGGGAGGAILLEAPEVLIDGIVAANGGGGGGEGAGCPGQLGDTPACGGVSATSICAGGAGGAAAQLTGEASVNDGTSQSGGGGGGGAGSIRIRSATATPAVTGVLSPSPGTAAVLYDAY